MRVTIMSHSQTQKIIMTLAIPESQSTEIIHRVLPKTEFHVSSNSVINQHIIWVVVLFFHCLFFFHHSQTLIVCYMIKDLSNQYEADKESFKWKTMLWTASISMRDILSSPISLTLATAWSPWFEISHLMSLRSIRSVRTLQLSDLLLLDSVYTFFFFQFKQHRCKSRSNWKSMLQDLSWWSIKMI